LEEFVQTTFGQWSVHGGSVDEYAWRVVSEGELKRRKAEAEQKAAEDDLTVAQVGGSLDRLSF
jgi:hypothetical protein